jgi:hypothetical protein
VPVACIAATSSLELDPHWETVLIPLTFTLVRAAQEMPKTARNRIVGEGTVKTETLHGTVLAADGSHLAVSMSTGEIRNFNVPASRKFNIDGQELTVGQLKPGTRLTATVVTTTTPVTERATTIGTGKVFYASGNTVIVTLPNNENRMYKVDDNFRFTVDGQPTSVHDLKPGMVVSAQKIVEEPLTEISMSTTVTGTAH